MTTVYLVKVTGSGTSTQDAWRPDAPPPFATLMIDPAKSRCVVMAADGLASTDRLALLTGTDLTDLQGKAQATKPNNPQRKMVNDWLGAKGYEPLTTAQVTWADVIHHVARQVNPAADLALTGV